jgi:hypothetical protein
LTIARLLAQRAAPPVSILQQGWESRRSRITRAAVWLHLEFERNAVPGTALHF